MSDNAPIPSAPDYSGLVSAMNNIAASSQQNGADALAWAKDQFANNAGLRDQVNSGLLDTQTKSNARADRNDAQSQDNLTQGDQFLRDQVSRYTDPSRVAADMGAAQANVAQQFEGARAAATRQLEGYGIDPSSTRYAALDIGTRAQQAAAAAGAGTMASRADDALAAQANDKVVAQGNVEAGTVNPALNTGMQAGTGALTGALATTASGQSGIGTDLAWTGAGTTALGGAGTLQNSGFQNSLDSAKATNSASSGIGSLIGGLAGLSKSSLGGSALTSLGTSALSFLEDGGVVPEGPTTGGAIPIGASPSRGAITDDVNARVNAGEFVVPRDVAMWKGEEFFQKLIQGSRKAKETAPAKPAIGGPPGGAAFRSQPVGAIPA